MSTANPPNKNFLYGDEYQKVNNIFPSKHNHNVPCAVCYTSTKVVQLMIPAKTACPTSWTVEYVGYLIKDDIVIRDLMFLIVLIKILTLFIAFLVILIVLCFI